MPQVDEVWVVPCGHRPDKPSLTARLPAHTTNTCSHDSPPAARVRTAIPERYESCAWPHASVAARAEEGGGGLLCLRLSDSRPGASVVAYLVRHMFRSRASSGC